MVPRGSYGTRLLKPLEPWDEDESRDAGYLAAAFDGEGWLSTGGAGRGIHKMGFAQRGNEMLDRVELALKERGYVARRHLETDSGFAKTDIFQISICSRAQMIRFLGSVRPHRLLGKFTPAKLGCMLCPRSALVGQRDVGMQHVTRLRTSSATYISEGFAVHDCRPLPPPVR